EGLLQLPVMVGLTSEIASRRSLGEDVYVAGGRMIRADVGKGVEAEHAEVVDAAAHAGAAVGMIVSDPAALERERRAGVIERAAAQAGAARTAQRQVVDECAVANADHPADSARPAEETCESAALAIAACV